MSQAERAVNEAKQSNAGVTAPVELKTAEDKLTAARAAAAKGEHNEAIRQADQALADADTRAPARPMRKPRRSPMTCGGTSRRSARSWSGCRE